MSRFLSHLRSAASSLRRGPLAGSPSNGPSSWEAIWISHPAEWADAARRTSGYDAEAILERVEAATLAVTTGRAAYARDGVTFDEVEYSWPVLAGLLKASVDAHRPIDVLDFGGGLGTSYHQNRGIMGRSLRSWRIVEQPRFVARGNRQFRDATLSFWPSLDAALSDWRPDVILISAVLQYLADLYATLGALFDVRAPTMILDLLAVTDDSGDCLTVQHVPTDTGWEPAYPTWFFGAQRFVTRFPAVYRVDAAFSSHIGSRLWIDQAPKGRYVGFLLRLEDAPAADRTW